MFSSSARFSLLLLSCCAGPKPSAPTTSIVVRALTSSAVAPPRRTTSSRAALRLNELSLPVKTTSCPDSGGGPCRSGEGESKQPPDCRGSAFGWTLSRRNGTQDEGELE